MCCCNRQNRCCCRCCRCGCCCSGSGNNGGAVTLPAFDQLSLRSSGGSSAARWPVYVSVPAFLWEDEEDTSDSCGCCRG